MTPWSQGFPGWNTFLRWKRLWPRERSREWQRFGWEQRWQRWQRVWVFGVIAKGERKGPKDQNPSVSCFSLWCLCKSVSQSCKQHLFWRKREKMTIFKKAKMAKANMAKMVRDSMERVRYPRCLVSVFVRAESFAWRNQLWVSLLQK